jgi:hypothetical protein
MGKVDSFRSARSLRLQAHDLGGGEMSAVLLVKCFGSKTSTATVVARTLPLFAQPFVQFQSRKPDNHDACK